MRVSALKKDMIRAFMYERYKDGKDAVIQEAEREYQVPVRTLKELWSEVIANTGVKPQDERKETTHYKGRKRQFFRFYTDHISINWKKPEVKNE